MYLAFQRLAPGPRMSRALHPPLLAGLAASFAMSALGPVAPDGVLGVLVTGSLGVVVYLVGPASRGELLRANSNGIPSVTPAAVEPERKAA